MSYETVGQLIDRWLADEKFRAEMRKGPDRAVQEIGMTLTTEEWTVLRTVDWNLSDDVLRGRMTKAFV